MIAKCALAEDLTNEDRRKDSESGLRFSRDCRERDASRRECVKIATTVDGRQDK